MAITKTRYIFTLMLLILFPLINEAQSSKKKPIKIKAKKTQITTEKPKLTWDKYNGTGTVYFPDYYAFYDPERGYIFWNVNNNKWTTSSKPPTFMSKVNMSRTRIQILKDLSLDLHPETNYPNYMKLYPAQINDPLVPVPNQKQGYK